MIKISEYSSLTDSVSIAITVLEIAVWEATPAYSFLPFLFKSCRRNLQIVSVSALEIVEAQVSSNGETQLSETTLFSINRLRAKVLSIITNCLISLWITSPVFISSFHKIVVLWAMTKPKTSTLMKSNPKSAKMDKAMNWDSQDKKWEKSFWKRKIFFAT